MRSWSETPKTIKRQVAVADDGPLVLESGDLRVPPAEEQRDDMTQSDLSTIPLVFSFTQVVAGAGFFAGVRLNGRALLEIESDNETDKVWVTGIAPVGIAAGGADRGEAFIQFRNAWIETVFDIAAKAESFEAFRRGCVAFLSAQQDSMTRLWSDAVAAVRQEKYEDPSLARTDADSHRVAFEVVDLTATHRGAAANEVEPGVKVAA